MWGLEIQNQLVEIIQDKLLLAPNPQVLNPEEHRICSKKQVNLYGWPDTFIAFPGIVIFLGFLFYFYS